ncbi:MAG: cytochrome c oxidase subunit II [Hyphomonadaceae bacterium]|nr:cytochrome c oxidase subunit II [Hyphomonadaceae bacterium]
MPRTKRPPVRRARVSVTGALGVWRVKIGRIGSAVAQALILTAIGCGFAVAQTVTGPVDGQIGLQPAATEVAEDIVKFHTLLLWIITPITLFVLALLLYVVLRYNRAANPTPRKFTHNVAVEVVWTVVPVLILVFISLFSFPLLFKQEQIPPAQLTIKATGNAWRWDYSYPDQGVDFASLPLSEKDATSQNRPFRMAVDEPMYVPAGVNVRMLVTSNDVIHAFSVPSFGIKEDAMPGKVNETWFNVPKEGTYYGFCQELCGTYHGFMPIEVRVVSQAEFDRWITSKGGELAAATPAAAPAAPETAPAETPAPAGAPGR